MNDMTHRLVAAAVCTALGSSAHAFSLAQYATAEKIFFGGSTSLDNTLERVFLSTVDGICDRTIGNIDIWRATNQRVITCFVSDDNTPGHGFRTRAQGGTSIAFHKESAGGSSHAVTSVAAAANGGAHGLTWLDLGALPLSTTCTVAGGGGGNLVTHTNRFNCPLVQTTSATTLHGGISDNDPALAYAAGGINLSGVLQQNGPVVVFGVPVSTRLYRVLQRAQYGGSCDNSDLPSCVPTLTRSQLRSLFAYETDWWYYKDPAGVPLTNLGTPTDPLARICRRVAASGTQASFEAYFFDERCDVPGLMIDKFALPDDASTIFDTTYSPNDFLSGSLVNAAPSSAGMLSCLASANTNGYWALGMLSTEVTDTEFGAGGSAGFRFIAIDGAAPNFKNVANGDYDFFTESRINSVASITGVAAEVIELLVEKLNAPAVLANINLSYDGRPWGNGGVMARAGTPTTNTAPYSDAEMTASPVNTQSKLGRTCFPATMLGEQPVDGTPNR